MSSAVTQVGKLAKKYVKLHSVDFFTPLVGLADFQRKDSDLPTRWYQVPDGLQLAWARLVSRRASATCSEGCQRMPMRGDRAA